MNESKKLRALIRACWVVLIVVWLVCFIIGEKLNVVIHNERLIAFGNFIDSYDILRNGLALILYYFNMMFIVYAILKRKLFSYRPIVISIFIVGVWTLKFFLLQFTSLASFVDFIYIAFVIILEKKKWLRAIIGMLLTLLFSFLCVYVKNYNGIKVENLPSLIASIMMIDYYIMFIINYLYSIKEVNDNATMGCILWKSKGLENHKWSFSNIISSCRSNYRSFISCLKTDGWKIYCSIIFFIITYGSILIVGYIYRRIIEVTIAVICFHLFRRYDSKTYHASTSIKCWCVSFISFGTLIKLSIPITHSIFVVILLSYLLTKIMYYTQELIDHIQENKISKDLKRLENMSMEELKELFDEYSQNDLHAIYKCLHKDRSTTYEYIALKHNMSRMTLYRIMKNVRNKYNSLINK